MGKVVRPDWLFCNIKMTSSHRTIGNAIPGQDGKKHGMTALEAVMDIALQPIRRVCGPIVSSLVVLVLVLGMIHPLAAWAATDDRSEIRVVGRLPLELNAKQHDEFIVKTKELARMTRANDNLVSYSCNSDIEIPNTYVFEEVWPSEEALRAHLETDHFSSWWAWVEPHLSGELVINVASIQDFHELS